MPSLFWTKFEKATTIHLLIFRVKIISF